MIKLEIQQGIANVILSRAEKQNALSFDMFMQLNSTIKRIKKDKSVRAVVIKGDGEHFCSGLDVAAVMASPLNIVRLLLKWLPGNQNLAQKVVLGWQSLSVPVIAQINGNCLGGGLQIALGADYRIVDTQAKLAIMEARWGLCPDMGANVVLAGLLKRDQALWLASHANPISAYTAYELGLVTELTDNTEQATQRMLNILRERSPDTLAAIKRVTQQSYTTNQRQILAKETFSQIRLLLNPNTKKAIAKAKGKTDISYANSKRW
ncbi:crotonase/enoyl-CoA hydratase family protein [Pseudoalteromonas sp. CST5]|uniref:crotonase/enoyl-CoA hydratase family protein n=1 Tax=unclassified Pseudoalteromonas TaxID=194690 RepID=UPI0020BF6C9E|nr:MULTISPECIES: crotonase/enoyl-CoA hydratase family protein [unclassified Pseudoalteromonas]MCK8133129.1 crotonase/enoyl-CoA hydratase family protein [Pseudoalteromonas sp. 2CM28B]MDC9512526.1 crotonase/enoyl-CoA hydratase family protein [Pseudoalteromonas sp. CST1]MDC9537085.1 crotonase/enoyl-CoA hydratase family protein [Pseudoalteromonas sp. CST3]MDC9540269.1 crotonase/enoyl-CoA hydratase family protein [Pseudoalteromonas sp. CST2]MDC9544012.1 crotonase/enoyl-CoA hydratase family protein 